jgi:hypothetical protein
MGHKKRAKVNFVYFLNLKICGHEISILFWQSFYYVVSIASGCMLYVMKSKGYFLFIYDEKDNLTELNPYLNRWAHCRITSVILPVYYF